MDKLFTGKDIFMDDASGTSAQVAVAVTWWRTKLTRMYARTQHPQHMVTDNQLRTFSTKLYECLLECLPPTLDATASLPDVLRRSLELAEVGANADLYMDGFMCFPNGGVLVHDGVSVDENPINVLIPFKGNLVWEEWVGYCGKGREVTREQEDDGDGPLTVIEKENDKVWAAALVVSCSEGSTLEWIYYARYGKRGGSLQEGGTKRFGTDQQAAFKHYRTNVRSNNKPNKYIPIAFDQIWKTPFDDFSDYVVSSFVTHLGGKSCSLPHL